jgi:hypothetical protein
MAKAKLSKSPSPGKREAKASSFKDRDLTKVNPLTEQFEPSGSEPVRQRYKMAGGA